MKKLQQTDTSKLEAILTKNFEKIDERFESLERELKVMEQERYNGERGLSVDIKTSSFSTEQKLQKTFRAELQVANNELENRLGTRLKVLEEKLNKRITIVGDLITKYLGNKITDQEKRIKKLEKTIQTA